MIATTIDPADVQSHVIAALKEAAGVSDAVQDRVYPDNYPQDIIKIGAVRVSLIGMASPKYLAGHAGSQVADIQVDTVHPLRAEATKVGLAAKRRLVNHGGTIGSLSVKATTMENEFSRAETPEGTKSDNWRYTYTFNIRIHYCDEPVAVA